MSRNFHVKTREPVITESDCRMIRDLSIWLGIVAAVLFAAVLA